jgi:hypothetical protein
VSHQNFERTLHFRIYPLVCLYQCRHLIELSTDFIIIDRSDDGITRVSRVFRNKYSTNKTPSCVLELIFFNEFIFSFGKV